MTRALFAAWKGRWTGAAIACFTLAAAACSTTGGGGLGLGGGAGPVIGNAPVTGEVLGTGTIKIGLLLPLSAQGNIGALALNLKNAADLALRDFPSSNLQILVKDDGGTANGAANAAREATSQGAELILGPLLADTVAAAAGGARGVPIVAFSTDTTKISRGVYLLSFTPQADVDRVVGYAASQGKHTFAALVPNNPSGTLYASAFQSAVARNGGSIAAIDRYDTDQTSMQQHATTMAMTITASKVDAVLLPESSPSTPFLAQIIAANGVKPGTVTYLGTGQWNDPKVITESNVSGGWYPSPDNTSFAAFSARYKAAFMATPLRTATLAYDAVSLAAGLAAKYGPDRFSPAVLANPNGFIGADGAFRLNADGTSTRGLAIYEVKLGKTSIADPAPKSFGPGA